MRWSLLLLSQLWLGLLGTASGGSGKGPSLVRSISGELEFGQLLPADGPLALVAFHAPWCGHCKSLMPRLAQVSEQLAEQPLLLATVDCTDTANAGLRDRFGVTRFPTLVAFQDGIHWLYQAGRDANSILDFLTARLAPVVRVSDKLPDRPPLPGMAVVVLVDPASDSQLGAFQRIASRQRELYSFIQLGQPTGHFAAGSVHALQWKDEWHGVAWDDSSEVLESEQLFEGWLEMHLAPDVLHLSAGPASGQERCLERSTLPRLLLFAPSGGGSAGLGKQAGLAAELRVVARQERGRLRAVEVSPSQAELRAEFGLQQGNEPKLFVRNGTTKHLCTRGVPECVERFFKGELPQFYRSRSVSARGRGLQGLEREEFSQFVRPGKNYTAAVLFYSSAGREGRKHAKLQPLLESIAAAYQHEPQLQAGQYDLQYNDPPEGIEPPHRSPGLLVFRPDSGTPVEPAGETLVSLEQFAELVQAASPVPLSPVFPTFLDRGWQMMARHKPLCVAVGLVVGLLGLMLLGSRAKDRSGGKAKQPVAPAGDTASSSESKKEQ